MTGYNFRWIDDKVAGSHRPTKEELEIYKRTGINTIVCLQTCDDVETIGSGDYPLYSPAEAREMDIDFIHIPVPDQTPPLDDQFEAFVTLAMEPGRKTAVHCFSGTGRTGCMLAAYLAIAYDLSPTEAINRLRAMFYPYIATPEQELGTRDWIERHNRNKKKTRTH